MPPLQGGEHMTVGQVRATPHQQQHLHSSCDMVGLSNPLFAHTQVRHPALRSAFALAFQNWFFATKRACKKWKGTKLDDTAVPHLLKASNAKLTAKAAKHMTKMLAAALGEPVCCFPAAVNPCLHAQNSSILPPYAEHAYKMLRVVCCAVL